jgi:hypothetical protein
MAYDFFPKSETEILSKLKTFPDVNAKEVVALFNALKQYSPTPINLDVKQKTVVNIARPIASDLTMAQITSKAGLKVLKPKFGNGSSGNRGVNNRGNLFEPVFARALEDWWNDGDKAVSDTKVLNAILDLDKTYGLHNAKDWKIEVVGGENTKRPLVFGNKITLSNPKGQGTNIGASVTDITVTYDSKKIYLSLKLGSTTTFFNSGVRTILTPQEIQKGTITNASGIKLLNIFGIDNEKFCKIFNGDLLNGEVVKNAPYDREAITALLESGIGHNYHIIHKFPAKIISKKMDEIAMQKAAKIASGVTIYYGGKGGNAKRIDIEFQSPTYKFKINIRDTQGKDGYPTRMMCDFGYV